MLGKYAKGVSASRVPISNSRGFIYSEIILMSCTLSYADPTYHLAQGQPWTLITRPFNLFGGTSLNKCTLFFSETQPGFVMWKWYGIELRSPRRTRDQPMGSRLRHRTLETLSEERWRRFVRRPQQKQCRCKATRLDNRNSIVVITSKVP
jgi:hypothetical protein